jgi:hypothetical protein
VEKDRTSNDLDDKRETRRWDSKKRGRETSRYVAILHPHIAGVYAFCQPSKAPFSKTQAQSGRDGYNQVPSHIRVTCCRHDLSFVWLLSRFPQKIGISRLGRWRCETGTRKRIERVGRLETAVEASGDVNGAAGLAEMGQGLWQSEVACTATSMANIGLGVYSTLHMHALLKKRVAKRIEAY